MKMPFGMHKGKNVEDLPTEYLQWLWDTVYLHDPLRTKVAQALGLEPETEPRAAPKSSTRKEVLHAARDIVKVGFREWAKKSHPDVGGSNGAMKTLNEAHDYLKKLLE